MPNSILHQILYLSPAGTTRKVADGIFAELQSHGVQATRVDLAQDQNALLGGENSCLWIGSPVYVHHPLPQVLDFVHRLPVVSNAFAVPFVTWGAVCSGMALWDLGTALTQRGYGLLGAAKVLAEHSTFWREETPLGAGHPDEEDLHNIRQLVTSVWTKIDQGPSTINPARLDYQPPHIREISTRSSLDQARQRFGSHEVDRDRCIQCGTCHDNCPISAITMVPFPSFGNQCIQCNRCVRVCPQEAIPFDPAPRVGHIRTMRETFGESGETTIFI